MGSWIGIIGGLIIAVAMIIVVPKIKILHSTKNLFGIGFWFLFMWFELAMAQFSWPFWFGFLIFAIQLFEYFKNKRLERAILNTVQYMINQKYKKEISAQEISSELDYDFEFVAKILTIYKRNAIIPYDISINTEF